MWAIKAIRPSKINETTKRGISEANNSDDSIKKCCNEDFQGKIENQTVWNHSSPKTNRFESRRIHVERVCFLEGRTPPKDIAHSKLFPKMILELPHNILYCPVEKVASTFWRKTLTAMNSMGYFNSPFDVRGKRFKLKTFFHHIQYSTNLNMESFRKHATSLLVVRNPYSKLFSAYVDKLYHPNSLFWNHIGKPIERIIANKSSSGKFPLCGQTVTFANYVKYLIYKFEEKESINTHFTSISSHCDPCVTKYDYISKLETFKDDINEIMSKWNKTFNLNIQFRDFEKDSAIEIARVHINLALYTKKLTEVECSIPSSQFLLRTWRFLQISGIIPKHSKLPTQWSDTSFSWRSDLLLADVLHILQNNNSWPIVKKQRKEAMLQAYRTVTKEDLYKLREIVKQDCRYFDYDDMPADIFNCTTSDTSVDFDYFDAVK